MATAAHRRVSSLPLALLLLALLSTDALAEDATSRQQQASHLVAEAATPADFEAMTRVESEARAINERLVFQLLNLTGITFRMWFCGHEPVQDKRILARLLEKANLSDSERQAFLRWYTLKLRMAGNSAHVWRGMGAEAAMKNIECTSEQVANSRAWMAQQGQ